MWYWWSIDFFHINEYMVYNKDIVTRELFQDCQMFLLMFGIYHVNSHLAHLDTEKQILKKKEEENKKHVW